jgi:hypothetical protein
MMKTTNDSINGGNGNNNKEALEHKLKSRKDGNSKTIQGSME